MQKLTVGAQDSKGGMSLNEVQALLAQVKTQGFTAISKVRVGWRGQIIEITFGKEDNDG